MTEPSGVRAPPGRAVRDAERVERFGVVLSDGLEQRDRFGGRRGGEELGGAHIMLPQAALCKAHAPGSKIGTMRAYELGKAQAAAERAAETAYFAASIGRGLRERCAELLQKAAASVAIRCELLLIGDRQTRKIMLRGDQVVAETGEIETERLRGRGQGAADRVKRRATPDALDLLRPPGELEMSRRVLAVRMHGSTHLGVEGIKRSEAGANVGRCKQQGIVTG